MAAWRVFVFDNEADFSVVCLILILRFSVLSALITDENNQFQSITLLITVLYFSLV